MGIKLKVVTPDGVFIDDKEVEIVNVQTIDGDIGILGQMAPLVSALNIGTMSFRERGNVVYVHLHRGIVKVDGAQCKIITERLYLVDEQGTRQATPDKLI